MVSPNHPANGVWYSFKGMPNSGPPTNSPTTAKGYSQYTMSPGPPTQYLWFMVEEVNLEEWAVVQLHRIKETLHEEWRIDAPFEVEEPCNCDSHPNLCYELAKFTMVVLFYRCSFNDGRFVRHESLLLWYRNSRLIARTAYKDPYVTHHQEKNRLHSNESSLQ
eukprot:TRINITY_DN33927_c0_g1_i2.p2 TRINITY_DN33927_c0_g1~~TRINITY_DN33927_c0_g1_i2.p2  ORF type:complete len:163 (-),score=1.00 TRINITY_DN33927_c0_g1_i2:119-607(-)